MPTTSDSSEPGIDASTPVLIDGQVRLLLPELVHHLRDVEFDRIDIVVSFIKMSGLNLLIGPLEDALERGAHVRVLTTDYLGLTEPGALARLHDLAKDDPTRLTFACFTIPRSAFTRRRTCSTPRTAGPRRRSLGAAISADPASTAASSGISSSVPSTS